jgi:hypothetical protein
MKSIFKKPFLLFIFQVCLISSLYSKSSDGLPRPDFRDNASPASIRGTIINAKDSILSIKNPIAISKKSNLIKIRITADTKLFTEAGGAIDLADLVQGQYAWIWYKNQAVNKKPTAPEAAVLILWSKDPKDQPTDKAKKEYDKKN